MERIRGRALIAGRAEGQVIFTNEPLSFWGGYDAKTGEIIDSHHALYGANVAGKIFVLLGGRGSSTGSGILLESIRRGTAPAAMILSRTDQILALGAIVGTELYGKVMPLVVVSESDFVKLEKSKRAQVATDGTVTWE
ncbi:MAG TPA: DUF126 domain-containing protein [Anaerolineae bacterium]|nr:DUF126 domain-containing protein [Anaerolineae bacterium]